MGCGVGACCCAEWVAGEALGWACGSGRWGCRVSGWVENCIAVPPPRMHTVEPIPTALDPPPHAKHAVAPKFGL